MRFSDGLGGTVVFLQTKEDKKPPTIQFQENETVYKAGGDYDSLLAGATAFDDQDGDVTDTLVVESIYLEKDQKKATVIYVARDKSNNIGKANRQLAYQESEQIEPSDDIEGSNDENEEPVKAVTEPNENEPVVQQEEENEKTQDEKPKITLTTDQVLIKTGDSVNRIAFVDSITDDKDDTDQLWGSIVSWVMSLITMYPVCMNRSITW